MSVVKTLFNRACLLSTSLVEQSIEESHIVQALKRNGYPTRFIRRSQVVSACQTWRIESYPPSPLCLTSTVSACQKSNVDSDVSAMTVYIQGLSECIKRVLSELDIVVHFYPMWTLRHLLVNLKPPNLINGVIYRVPCKQCDKVYIGQIGRSLECRLKEHKRAVKCESVDASAIAEHVWKEGHQVDWESAGVLNTYKYLYARCLLELWHIQKHHHTINRERGALPAIYCSLLT